MNTKPKFTVSCCVGAITRAVLQNPPFFYWVKMTWDGQELTYVFFEVSAHVSFGREMSPFAVGSDLFVSCVFYEGIWFQNFLCLDMLDIIIMLPPARTLLTQWRPLKTLKGKQREFNVRGVIGVFQSRYYCDDFSVSELSVEDAVSVF